MSTLIFGLLIPLGVRSVSITGLRDDLAPAAVRCRTVRLTQAPFSFPSPLPSPLSESV